jgi:hypothetical protein
VSLYAVWRRRSLAEASRGWSGWALDCHGGARRLRFAAGSGIDHLVLRCARLVGQRVGVINGGQRCCVAFSGIERMPVTSTFRCFPLADRLAGQSFFGHGRGHWFKPSIAHRKRVPRRGPKRRGRRRSGAVQAFLAWGGANRGLAGEVHRRRGRQRICGPCGDAWPRSAVVEWNDCGPRLHTVDRPRCRATEPVWLVVGREPLWQDVGSCRTSGAGAMSLLASWQAWAR